MSKKEKLNELQDRLGDIFNGIDDYYSQSILDELIVRIDTTIDDFNKEFQSLIGSLNSKPTKKRTTTRTTRKKPAVHRKKPSAPRKKPSTSRSKSKTLK